MRHCGWMLLEKFINPWRKTHEKMLFGIALILFGFSMAYISAQAQWAIMQPVSVLAVFAGLLFAVWGFIEKG